MAEKKNFIIENYNGTDYDTLYPETNSGQVLLDVDAQADLSLESGATLDDAVHVITKETGAFQVGDTLTTARTNLGDKWLLCNGDIFEVGQYPELDGVLSHQYLKFIKTQTTASTYTLNKCGLVVDDNNEQIVLWYTEKSGASGSSFQYVKKYANIIDGTWDWRTISNYSSTRASINIHQANGVWFFGNKYHVGKLTDDAEFTLLNTPTTSSKIIDVKYVNGKYYVLYQLSGATASGSKIAVYSDITQLPDVYFDAYGIENSLSVTEDKNGVIFTVTHGGTSSPYKPSFSILVGNEVIQTNQFTTTFPLSACIYYNGYYYYRSSNKKIYRAQSFTEVPTEVSYNDKLVDMVNQFQLNNALLFGNGYYVYNDNNFYSVDGVTITDGSDQIMTANSEFVYIPQFTDSTIDIYKSYSNALEIQLPTVSISDGLYTYIKAKS